MKMVNVRVSDILYYWSQHKNLEIIKEMDKRYQDTNILGKFNKNFNFSNFNSKHFFLST